MRQVPLLLLIALLAACPGGGPGASADRPNVILLVMDTTRADRCSAYGYPRPTTPALAALAKEGALYLNAWSPAGWTGPAHGSLFTGLRPENHSLTGGRRDYLPPCETLAARFAAHGYRTVAYSNNPLVSRVFGLDQGFAEFHELYTDTSRPYPFAASTHKLALEWIRAARQAGDPFFLFINHIEPHYPYIPPESFEARFVDRSVPRSQLDAVKAFTWRTIDAHNLGKRLQPPELIRVLSDLYDAEIACLDQEIGRFVEALRTEGVLDGTVLVVLGDHGEEFNEHGLLTHIGSLHAPIRRVPLVVRFPPAFHPGTVVEETVRLEDVPPTLLTLCGLPVPAGLDGQSFTDLEPGRIARARCGSVTPLLRRVRKDSPPPFDDSHISAELSAVFDGRWHLLRSSLTGDELYDPAADPEETFNLAGKEAKVAETLAPLLPALDGSPTDAGESPR